MLQQIVEYAERGAADAPLRLAECPAQGEACEAKQASLELCRALSLPTDSHSMSLHGADATLKCGNVTRRIRILEGGAPAPPSAGGQGAQPSPGAGGGASGALPTDVRSAWPNPLAKTLQSLDASFGLKS